MPSIRQVSVVLSAVMLIYASGWSAVVLEQDFEDLSVFVVGVPFETTGVGDGNTTAGRWRNTLLDGNYTPKTAAVNSTFTTGVQGMELLRTSTYGSGFVVGARENGGATDVFQLDVSLLITVSMSQFSFHVVDRIGEGHGQVGLAYYGNGALRIRENGTWREICTTVPVGSWLRLVITGSRSAQSYTVYMDTGTGLAPVGTATFDATVLQEAAGIFVAPWTQNHTFYWDDVRITDEISLETVTVDWDSDTYVVWANKPGAIPQDVPVSMPDWYAWGEGNNDVPGVRYIINTLAANGLRTIWWRTIGGSATGYRPALEGVTYWQGSGFKGEEREFDALAEAIAFGHKLGIKIYGWFLPLEEYHGSSWGGRSRYTDLHDDLWEEKYVSAYVSTKCDVPSFYYAEYREYKIALADEIIRRYDIDGMVLDFERNGSRNNTYGYLKAIRDGYQAETGENPWFLATDDPEWMAYRARHVGKIVRRVKELIDASGKEMELVAWYPWAETLRAQYDIMTWADEGLFDRYAVFEHGEGGWGYPEAPPAGLYTSLSASLNKPVSFGVYLAHGTPDSSVAEAMGQGFDGLVWFESTPLVWRDLIHQPRELAVRDGLTIRSPACDMSGGGQVYVIAAGPWELGIDDLTDPVATGGGQLTAKVELPAMSGNHQLVVHCTLTDTGPAGIAVEGTISDGLGGEQAIRTDTHWENLSGTEALLRFGQPGIPPFLGIIE